MANCMIYYNAKILNSLLEKLQKDGSKELIEYLKYISPAAWININLYGFYTFEKDSTQIDLAKLAESINILKTV
ncbi:MAG: Transposase, Tn3 [uncultured bacterium]|nr:MAG: Transposase, Tn3 [uncultured bacterium]